MRNRSNHSKFEISKAIQLNKLFPMNSKLPFITTIILLLITLFFLQRSQTSISESNKSRENVKEVLQKVVEKLDESNISSSQTPDSGFDPTEKEKYSTMTANLSTEISQGSTGNIDLEEYWSFKEKVSKVVIQANSLKLIQSRPTKASLPPPEKLDLKDRKAYKNASRSFLTLDENQRYIEVNANSQEGKGDKLYQFKFQVKGKKCDCWSDSEDGYLFISVK